MNYVVVGLLVSVFLAGSTAYVEHARIAALNSKVGQLTEGLKTCTDDNASNQTTIADLQSANSKYAADAKLANDAAAKAVKVAHAADVARGQVEGQIKALKIKDQGNAPCDRLLNVDLASACPNVAAAIMERAK